MKWRFQIFLRWALKLYDNQIGILSLMYFYLHSHLCNLLQPSKCLHYLICSSSPGETTWVIWPRLYQYKECSLRVGQDWVTSLSLFTFMHWRRKWQPTPLFLPGESQRRGSLVGCRLWGRTESDMTEET